MSTKEAVQLETMMGNVKSAM